ncbi:hypothetical protein A2531_06475 [Candidatus Falkowbacteria bacterium RIFOXYD2_FULL_34_120]|uniref:Uncharacterized protein n=1 Tax=Candidatus Falkowbacteria bacterium RIFOXYD2_FULL_34_120 TaxID=1798007 RepID=A0A1F5TMH8_9BACT|nr:MAG: hypothetical protein A2500_05125 [Candidatus Falkowbacteria bacterium RIFOXYC12_FULL_34_55]OGF38016.1 MAG: hypothetical protein A2466_03835 [Candidatus Falkowbacteria bacterium RIFOXYC2_FULL_34_220]OGF38271.1 MAG: hypothetical protein A2515_00745 [Candidatus Falkowbacteria bacterium RIFOXYD12_FULL_34_57]OGF40162.1 MAG: hypothetical protein A2531_06475 [Candidatus Falkowbacteria bacterium RIFOXYD2_FULL_34_120]
MENSKTIEFFKWLGSFMGFLAVCWIFNKDLPVIHPWMSIWLFISFISARIAVDRLKDDLFINFFWSGALKIFFNLIVLIPAYSFILRATSAAGLAVKFAFFLVFFEIVFLCILYFVLPGLRNTNDEYLSDYYANK